MLNRKHPPRRKYATEINRIGPVGGHLCPKLYTSVAERGEWITLVGVAGIVKRKVSGRFESPDLHFSQSPQSCIISRLFNLAKFITISH